MNRISRDNFKVLFGRYIENNELLINKISESIGCSKTTMIRLIKGETKPSDEILKQAKIMMEIGFKKYSKLTGAEKEKISKMMESVGGRVKFEYSEDKELLDLINFVLKNKEEKITIIVSDNNNFYRVKWYLRLLPYYNYEIKIELKNKNKKIHKSVELHKKLPSNDKGIIYPDSSIPFIAINNQTYKILRRPVTKDVDKYIHELDSQIKKNSDDQNEFLNQFYKNEDDYKNMEKNNLICRYLILTCFKLIDKVTSKKVFSFKYKVFLKFQNMVRKSGVNLLTYLVFFSLIKNNDKYNELLCNMCDESSQIELDRHLLFFKDLLYQVIDIADGLLQLIENVVVHAGNTDKGEGFGILSYRFFEKSHDTLIDTYTDYINNIEKFSEDNSIDISNFLNIIISDISNQNIITNHRKKEGSENISLQEIYNRRNISGSSLSQESIIHYGLDLFQTIIMKRSGYFEVRAIDTNYDGKGDQGQFIRTVENNKEKKENRSIEKKYNYTSTNYSILFPIIKKKSTSEFNMNMNYRYDSMFKYDDSKAYNLTERKISSSDGTKKSIKEYLKYNLKAKDKNIENIKKYLQSEIENSKDSKYIWYYDIKGLDGYQLEILLKSILLLIYEIYQDKLRDVNIYFAFINSTEPLLYQIINLISIYSLLDINENNFKCQWLKGHQIYACTKDYLEFRLLDGDIKKSKDLIMHTQLNSRVITNSASTIESIIRSKALIELGLENQDLNLRGEKKNKQISFFSNTEITFEERLFPFQLKIKENESLIFEKMVKKSISKNIQHQEFGTKLENTHVSVGSKIHVGTFYELEQVFYNNYYARRFAFIILDKYLNQLKNKNDLTLFLGYQSYSEILISNINSMIGRSSDYIIYENTNVNMDKEYRFKYIKKFIKRIEKDEIEKVNLVIVVPISSTLTTFNKVLHQFYYKLKDTSNTGVVDKIKKVFFFSIFQLRDKFTNQNKQDKKNVLTENEKKFEWEKIDSIKKVIKSEKMLSLHGDGKGEEISDKKTAPFETNNKVNYSILIPVKWYLPEACKFCNTSENENQRKVDFLKERPLIQTNKSSTVPRQLIGLKNKNENYIPQLDNEKVNIKEIKEHLLYRHISRGDHHYQYFIKNEDYIIESKEKIKNWLEKESKYKDDIFASFNIIIAPAHFSNNLFVKMVNDYYFRGTALIIQFDVEKEFRDNILTKFSDITLFLSRINENNKREDINFHYVDDAINTGESFSRVRNLLKSLFPKDINNLNINIEDPLENIFVVIDRLSNASKKRYISDIKKYHAFTKINISYMRNHRDACYLCAKKNSYDRLSKASSTNGLSDFYKKKSNKYKCIDYAEYFSNKTEEPPENHLKKERRGKRRFICSHVLKNILSSMGEEKNNNKKLLEIIILLLHSLIQNTIVEEFSNEIDVLMSDYHDDNSITSNEYKYEVILSLLYSLVNPFLAYRKSVKEVGMLLVNFFLDLLLHDDLDTEYSIETNEESETEWWYDILSNHNEEINQIRKFINSVVERHKKYQLSLMKFLLKRSVILKSNYILNKNIMRRMYQKMESLSGDSEIKNNIIYIISLYKELTSLNTDKIKAIRLEKILTSFRNQDKEKEIGNYQKFIELMYLENIQIIYDTVNLYYKKKSNLKNSRIDEYYYKDYKKFHMINNQEKCNKSYKIFFEKYSEFVNLIINKDNNSSDSLSDENKGKSIYDKFIEKIISLTEAEKGGIYVKSERSILKLNKEGDENSNEKSKYFGEYFVIEGKESCLTKLGGGINENNLKELDKKLDDKKYYIEKSGKNIFFISKYEVNNFKNSDIYIYLEFKEDDDYFDVLNKSRRFLAFRNKVQEKIKDDFNTPTISDVVHRKIIHNELNKPRAANHCQPDEKYSWYNKIKEDPLQETNELESYIIGLKYSVFNLFLARSFAEMNIKQVLGNNGEPKKVPIVNNRKEKRLIFADLSDAFIDLKYLKYNKSFTITHDNETYHVDDDSFLLPSKGDAEILSCVLANIQWNNREYPPEKNKLITVIQECIKSAVNYGKKEDHKINVNVYLDKEDYYLCIKNKIESSKKLFSKVQKGLRREKAGTSLATICGYFKNRYNRSVKIEFDEVEGGEWYTIKLPIFTNQRFYK